MTHLSIGLLGTLLGHYRGLAFLLGHYKRLALLISLVTTGDLPTGDLLF